MFRTSDVILIAVMLSAAAFTYKTKHEAEAMMERVATLEKRIQLEKDTMNLLKADWSLFTQPARLARLATVYEAELGLKTVEPRQIAELAALRDIPFRPKTVEDLIAEAGRDPDPMITGGVRP